IKKVQPNRALRALCRSHQLGDRNRRSVRRKDGVFFHNAVEYGIHLFLLRNTLDNRFNDYVAITKIFATSSPFQPCERLFFLLLSNAALLRRAPGEFAQRLLNSGESFVEKSLLDFKNSGIESSHR